MLKATDSLQYLKPSMGKSNINNNGNGSVTEIIENQALKTISQNKICMIIKEKKCLLLQALNDEEKVISQYVLWLFFTIDYCVVFTYMFKYAIIYKTKGGLYFMKKIIYLSILILCISNITGCSNENIEETVMQTESLENERGTGYVLSTEQRAEKEDTKQYYKYSELERTLEKIKEKTEP